jgi:hypothetical protein
VVFTKIVINAVLMDKFISVVSILHHYSSSPKLINIHPIVAAYNPDQASGWQIKFMQPDCEENNHEKSF